VHPPSTLEDGSNDTRFLLKNLRDWGVFCISLERADAAYVAETPFAGSVKLNRA
jgi:hypothetical protein